ncbi:MAG TPA: hydrogenase maturation protease [Candidatus Binatia bacterium]|nr:hydrogenase maturation protease [Candidatus Binatia bacterium]
MGAATAPESRIAVAGFGNVLLGDDGFGVEVIKCLRTLPLPVEVETLDIGIGGMDLVLKLMDGFNEMIVVDAVRRGNAPGTLYVFEPGARDLSFGLGERIDPHLAEPTSSMKMAKKLGILPEKITVVGCEPASCALRLGLSAPVKAVVEKAAAKILSIIGYVPNASTTTG